MEPSTATVRQTGTLVRGQIQLYLKILKLSHEVEVRCDICFLDAHVFVGGLEAELLLEHEVGDCDGD